MTGTTVKRRQNDLRSCTSGLSRGDEISPATSFHIVTPATRIAKTTASATDNADVNFNESEIPPAMSHHDRPNKSG